MVITRTDVSLTVSWFSRGDDARHEQAHQCRRLAFHLKQVSGELRSSQGFPLHRRDSHQDQRKEEGVETKTMLKPQARSDGPLKKCADSWNSTAVTWALTQRRPRGLTLRQWPIMDLEVHWLNCRVIHLFKEGSNMKCESMVCNIESQDLLVAPKRVSSMLCSRQCLIVNLEVHVVNCRVTDLFRGDSHQKYMNLW